MFLDYFEIFELFRNVFGLFQNVFELFRNVFEMFHTFKNCFKEQLTLFHKNNYCLFHKMIQNFRQKTRNVCFAKTVGKNVQNVKWVH
ncbi:hypothetical protein MmiAt1_01120 [Methanimicrococcus sp. At1]|uniref:Uncharacterized protein n=1 Tax=Methanimicrococcus hacksteinii TaxID=3028293 RepID=A0ABU3VMF6_9EURY|nr:hypothetical protein [Methanimicrococcus sp. At1]